MKRTRRFVVTDIGFRHKDGSDADWAAAHARIARHGPITARRYELPDQERLTDLLGQVYRLYQLTVVRKKVDRLARRARTALRRNPADEEARSILGWCDCRGAERERSPDVMLNAVVAILVRYWQVERARGPIKLDARWRHNGDVNKLDEGLLFLQECLLVIGVPDAKSTIGAILQRVKVVTVTHRHVNRDHEPRELRKPKHRK